MKVVAYLFYIGDDYYIFRCYEDNRYSEICPHGLADEKEIES